LNEGSVDVDFHNVPCWRRPSLLARGNIYAQKFALEKAVLTVFVKTLTYRTNSINWAHPFLNISL
jgi:hypothetical protein